MYTMKEVCDKVGISYETLRFYCNEDLFQMLKGTNIIIGFLMKEM